MNVTTTFRVKVRAVTLCAAWCAGLALPNTASAERWVATWATSSMRVGPMDSGPIGRGLEGRTVRQIVPLTVGGSAVRLRLSNRRGTGRMRLDDVHVGIPVKGAALAVGSNRRVTFNGKDAITIPAGAEALSDPLSIVLRDMADVAVSFHVAFQQGAPTVGGSGAQSFVAAGRATADVEAARFSRLGGAILLSAIDVLASDRVLGAVVALGDSITAGGRTSWPGALALRLAEQTGPTVAVLNYGVGGNRLLYDSACWGDSGLARLDEALSQSGVVGLIFAGLGGNDIRMQDLPGDRNILASGFDRPGPRCTNCTTAMRACVGDHELGLGVDELIAGVQQVVTRTRARGITVYGGYFPPFKDALLWTSQRQSMQDAVNAWTRTPGVFDGIVDFAAPCLDTRDSQRLHPKCDSGDQIHLSAAGAEAVATGMNVALLLRK